MNSFPRGATHPWSTFARADLQRFAAVILVGWMVSLCPLASGASALDASEALQFRHDDPLESRLWVSALIAVGLAVLAGASFVYSRRREKVESDGMPRSRLLKVVMLKRVHSKLHIVSVELNGRTQVVFADNGHALLELGRSELDSPGVIKAE